MTPEQVAELNHGVYRVYYPADPGERNNHTLAAVGSDYFGNRWIAAINWIGMPETRTRTDRTTYGTVPVAQTGDHDRGPASNEWSSSNPGPTAGGPASEGDRDLLGLADRRRVRSLR